MSVWPELVRGALACAPVLAALLALGITPAVELSLIGDGVVLASALAAALVTALAIFGPIAESSGLRRRGKALGDVLTYFGHAVRLALAVDLLLIFARALSASFHEYCWLAGHAAFTVGAVAFAWLLAVALKLVNELTNATRSAFPDTKGDDER